MPWAVMYGTPSMSCAVACALFFKRAHHAATDTDTHEEVGAGRWSLVLVLVLLATRRQAPLPTQKAA